MPTEFEVPLLLQEAKTAIEAQNITLAEEKLSALVKEEKYSPLGITLHFALANTYTRNNELDKALAVYDEMLANVPENLKPVVLEEAAFVAQMQGNKAKAIEYYKALIEANNPQSQTSLPFYKAQLKLLQAAN